MNAANAAHETITEHMGRTFAVEPSETQIVMVTGTKKDNEIVVTSISKYRGDVSLDTRKYYLSSDTNQWHPTGQGCKIPAKLVAQHLTLIAQRSGLIQKLATAALVALVFVAGACTEPKHCQTVDEIVVDSTHTYYITGPDGVQHAPSTVSYTHHEQRKVCE
jgi:hypothetical protein